MIVFVALQHGSALRRIDASAGPFSLHISLCSLQYFNVGSNNNIKKKHRHFDPLLLLSENWFLLPIRESLFRITFIQLVDVHSSWTSAVGLIGSVLSISPWPVRWMNIYFNFQCLALDTFAVGWERLIFRVHEREVTTIKKYKKHVVKMQFIVEGHGKWKNTNAKKHQQKKTAIAVWLLMFECCCWWWMKKAGKEKHDSAYSAGTKDHWNECRALIDRNGNHHRREGKELFSNRNANQYLFNSAMLIVYLWKQRRRSEAHSIVIVIILLEYYHWRRFSSLHKLHAHPCILSSVSLKHDTLPETYLQNTIHAQW